MQTIKLTLVKSLIIESVKNITFKKGQVDKSVDEKASVLAYHEQAGDEEYDERMLERSLYVSLEELKTHLSDYLTAGGSSSADNIAYTENNGQIIIKLLVSDRFNMSYTKSLAMLSSKYIEDDMLFLWFSPINEKIAAFWEQMRERDMSSIRRCFAKTAPSTPSYEYPQSVSVTGSAIEISVGEEATVTYNITANSIDDIHAESSDIYVATIGRSTDGFTVNGVSPGHCVVTLFSYHDDSVNTSIDVYVTNDD